jgi:hypothetical protein
MPKLDPAAPLASLRDLAGLDLTRAAEARGVKPPSEHEAERGGSQIRLSTLLAAADAWGLEIEIVARRKKDRG